MSVAAMAWAWNADAPPLARFVLLALAHVADDAGQVQILVATLAEMTGMKERTVQRALRILEQRGLIATKQQRRSPSVYQLLWRQGL